MRRLSPGSRIVIWTDALTTGLLLTTIECGLNGLLSSRLPPPEAAYALLRICRGDRLLRFDADPGEKKTSGSNRLAAAAEFDAQWMLHGAEPHGRET
jgi:DNA-binding NarL/FixJ family response regulator